MTRGSEDWLQQLLAKAGYRARDQSGVSPGPPKPQAQVPTPPASARPGLVPRETDILRAILEYLDVHPKVAWAVRINTGGFTDKSGQYVKFGFVGASDIIGQMCDGRILAVEVKRPGKRPTDDQAAFLSRVRTAHGVAFVATSIDDVIKGLKEAA